MALQEPGREHETLVYVSLTAYNHTNTSLSINLADFLFYEMIQRHLCSVQQRDITLKQNSLNLHTL